MTPALRVHRTPVYMNRTAFLLVVPIVSYLLQNQLRMKMAVGFSDALEIVLTLEDVDP